MTRRILSVLAVLAVVLSLTGQTAMADTSFNNVASAIATHPYRPVTDQAWQVTSASGSVGAVNEATAESENCTGCTAVALAFQVLIVSNAGPNLTLTNNATSINSVCVRCVSEAVADQWVVAEIGGQIRLTFAGQLQLAALHLEASLLLRFQPARLSSFQTDLDNAVNRILSQDVVEVPSRTPALPVTPAATPAVTPLAQPPSGITITHNEMASP